MCIKRFISPSFLASSQFSPNYQFGFRPRYSTIQLCHRVTDIIASSLELGEYCTGAFLDVSQAFDRVWHLGLLSKLKKVLPFTLFLILKSYLSHRFLQVSHNNSHSQIVPVLAGVPQGSILGPILYLVYTHDIPSHPDTHILTFADDTAVLSSHHDSTTASENLQNHLTHVENWMRLWKLTVNVDKSCHTTFTLKKSSCPPVSFYNTPLPTKDVVRYLGLFLDRRLTWNHHTKQKRLELKRRYSLLYRLIGRNSSMSLNNKVLIYKTLLSPLWTYGLEVWGSTKASNMKRIQSLQSRILRNIASAPYYVTNVTLHTDLNVPFVSDLAKSRYQVFHRNLTSHTNPIVQSLSTPALPGNPVRRLRRRWPRDLLH